MDGVYLLDFEEKSITTDKTVGDHYAFLRQRSKAIADGKDPDAPGSDTDTDTDADIPATPSALATLPPTPTGSNSRPE